MKKFQLFPYGQPVTGQDLIGRDHDIELILQNLRGGQSLLIPGPRRIGKSSAILEILRLANEEKIKTIYIDLMSVNTVRELANEIAAAAIDANNSKLKKLMRKLSTPLKDLLKFKEFKIAYKEIEAFAILRDTNTPEMDVLKESLDLIETMAKNNKQKIICAFDEFGEINSLDKSLTRIMRSKFQHHKNVSYIFSGSQESILEQMFSNPKEPFFGFAKELRLSEIKRHDFAKYIQKKLQKEGVEIDILMAKELCAWTATHPFYTKVFANHLYEYVVMNNIKKIDDKSILECGFQKAYESLKNDLERLWAELGAGVTRQVCAYLAIHEDSPFGKDGLKKEIETPRIAQSIRTLESKGIIQKINKGEYAFVNHFFKKYIWSMYVPDSEKRFLK